MGAVALALGQSRPSLAAASAPATSATTTSAPGVADAVIQIFLEGGLSHIDSFDPKPAAPLEIRGEFGTVSSRVSGVQFSGLWGQTASVADKFAVLRSVTHEVAPHDRACHLMLTGYPRPADTLLPSIGSIVAHELKARAGMPAYIVMPDAQAGYEAAGPGSLGRRYGAFSISGQPGEATFTPHDLMPPPGVATQPVPSTRPGAGIASAPAPISDDDMAAWHLASSRIARQAFDLKTEPDALRDAYGRTQIGSNLLLARRLVEAGARCVTVFARGWDMHIDLHPAMRALVPAMDQAIATLVRDLEQRGLLRRTLVLIETEFGRSPRINRDRGREHWPKVFSVLLGGGSIRAGQVVGSSSPDGSEPKENPIRPADVAATVLAHLGIDPRGKLALPATQPAVILRDGTPIRQLV